MEVRVHVACKILHVT